MDINNNLILVQEVPLFLAKLQFLLDLLPRVNMDFAT